jgi:hypothetical protein
MTLAPRVLILILLLACLPSLKSATVAPNYPAAIADARRTWSAEGKEIADLLRRLAAASDKAAKAEKELDRERKALADLAVERKAALEDLRNGAFCTGCGRTRSELLARGESFPHPGQQSRPATPEELAKAEQDFDNRATVIRRRIAALEPELKSAQAEVMDAHHRVMVVIPSYHKHLGEEQDNRLGKWLDEKTTAETDLKALQTTVAAQAGPAREKTTQQLTLRLGSAQSAEDRARQEERLFRKDVLAALDYLAGIARPIPERYGVSGPFLAGNIRTPPRAVGYTVPAVYVGGPAAPAPAGDLQQLLDGPARPKGDGAKTPAGDKSVQDLLNGK